jgi:hypothetical protein
LNVTTPLDSGGVDLSPDERDLVLAALFELQLTRSAFDGDPDAARIPFARISHEDILALVDKLGGERGTAFFGAFHDEWADDDVQVPDYPADETDEG